MEEGQSLEAYPYQEYKKDVGSALHDISSLQYTTVVIHTLRHYIPHAGVTSVHSLVFRAYTIDVRKPPILAKHTWRIGWYISPRSYDSRLRGGGCFGIDSHCNRWLIERVEIWLGAKAWDHLGSCNILQVIKHLVSNRTKLFSWKTQEKQDS